MRPGKEHPDPLPALVVQRASRLHEPGLAPELASEFKEVAKRLLFVAARRFLEEAIEVQLVALREPLAD